MPSSLEVTTPSNREIRVRRTFDAPPQLVFEFHTKPHLVQKWLLGPPGWTMPVCEIDLKVGGRYRYVWRNDAGNNEFGVQGEFEAVDAPDRLVHREVMDGVPGQALCTTTFERSNGGTLFALTILFESQELRDSALASGMTEGMSMSYDRLQTNIANGERRR
jgi:uncharacterized protein YndB with AHSA1/START domain